VIDADALLEPGEQLRALAPIGLAHGGTGPAADIEPVTIEGPEWLGKGWDAATRTPARKGCLAVVLSPLLLLAAIDGLGSTISDGIERLAGGVVVRGPRGSRARLVQYALNILGPAGDHLVVTDRRLVLATRDGAAVLAVGRDEVVAVRRRRRLLLNRRLDVTFSDGSRVVLAVPVDDVEHLRAPAKLAAALL
jgi:hypothetical protein